MLASHKLVESSASEFGLLCKVLRASIARLYVQTASPPDVSGAAAFSRTLYHALVEATADGYRTVVGEDDIGSVIHQIVPHPQVWRYLCERTSVVRAELTATEAALSASWASWTDASGVLKTRLAIASGLGSPHPESSKLAWKISTVWEEMTRGLICGSSLPGAYALSVLAAVGAAADVLTSTPCKLAEVASVAEVAMDTAWTAVSEVSQVEVRARMRSMNQLLRH